MFKFGFELQESKSLKQTNICENRQQSRNAPVTNKCSFATSVMRFGFGVIMQNKRKNESASADDGDELPSTSKVIMTMRND